MNTQTWMVRTSRGEEWGFIKRLIIDPMTRQIKEADVILAETGKAIRMSWEHFELEAEGIRLGVAQHDLEKKSPAPSEAGVAGRVAMDLWP